MFLCIMSLFLFFAVAFMAFQLKREKEYKIGLLNVQLQEYNSMAASMFGEGSSPKESLSAYVAGHGSEKLRLTVVDTSGRVVFDNVEASFESMPAHSDREEIRNALLHGSSYVIDRLSNTTNTEYFYSATFFPERGIVVRSAIPYDLTLEDSLRADRHFLWFAIAVILALAVVLSIYVGILDGNIEARSEMEKARTRRLMTQNISHELKTPVAGIRGYLETLAENPDIDSNIRKEFIDRSLSQTQRLTSLLDDISVLNRIDDAPQEWSFEDVDVTEMVQSMVSEMSGSLAAKGMTFHNLLPFGIHIHGNPSLIYSIFRNLADNSAAYAGDGARITLTASEEGDSWMFTFRDNGPGVPQGDIGHIFERFYRVDKGRSRKLGGTGLGLSIVKNAVMLHGGSITASDDGGLRMDFSLKK